MGSDAPDVGAGRTVPTARAARASVNWAIGIIGSFYILTRFLGFGAAALVGSSAIKAANPGGNSAAPLLAQKSEAAPTRSAVTCSSPSSRRCVRDHPGGGGGADDHRLLQLRPRLLRQHHQARAAGREQRGSGGADDRPGDRRHRGRARGGRAKPQRGLPGRPGVRGRGQRQPADDPVLALLEEVHHRRRGRGHRRRAVLLPHRGGGRADGDRCEGPVVQGRRPDLPMGEPGDRLHPARLRRRLARHAAVARAVVGGEVRGAAHQGLHRPRRRGDRGRGGGGGAN
jgi:hypothetical protein